MTLEEAKQLYFKYGCSFYNLSRDDNDAVNEIAKIASVEQRENWNIEYMDLKLSHISDSKDSGTIFISVLSLLKNRNSSYKRQAEELIKIYKECPFTDDVQKLLVAEEMFGGNQSNYHSGCAVLCFYGDFIEDINEASYKYQNLSFTDGAEIYSFSYSPDELNERAKKLMGRPEILYKYIRSDEFIKDREEAERTMNQFLNNKKSNH